MSKKFLLLLLCLLLGLYACTKNAPPDYPTIQITAPYSLAYFNVPGSIQVTGHVSDSKNLTSVTVYLGNGQNTPIEPVVSIPITSNSMNISFAYALNDIHLASGQYYMTITASNGTTVSSAFQQIYVTAFPTIRRAIYAVTRDASGVHAWGIDSVFKVAPSFSYTVSGDYSSSDANSYYQQFYIAAHDSGNVNVYSAPTPNYEWNVVGNVSPAPCFTNVYCNNDAEYISCYNVVNGYVKCYNHSGAIQAIYNSSPSYYPIKTFVWGGWMFIEEKNISSPLENISTFYSSTGAGLQQNNIPGHVVEMFGYDNNDIFIFGNNSSGGGYIRLYNIQNNTYYTPALPIAAYGQLLSAAQINMNTYLISFSNGTIYQYTYNPVGILSYINGVTASVVRYDNVNNQVITASGNIVSEYNYGSSSATLINSVTLSDSVRNLRILYNK